MSIKLNTQNTHKKTYGRFVGMLLSVGVIIANIFLMWPVLTTYAAVTQKVPTENGLVGYWSMNEGAGDKIMDMSGNGKTGTITGATWVTGKYGKALRFNGSDQFVTMPTTGSGIFNPNGTVSFWAKPEVMNGAWHGVVTQGSNDAGFWWVGVYAGNWTVYTNAGTGFLESSIPATPGNWYHIVAKQDGTNLTLYVNGVALTPVAFSGGGTTRELFFGRTQDYSEFYAGTLDDVRIYNRALSATEISNLYKSGSVTAKQVTNSGLVGYWSMNEGTGNKVMDMSGNGNNGTMTSATWVGGKYGKALNFNNTGMIDVGGASTYNITSGGLTISAWVKLNSLPNAYLAVVAKDNPGGESYWFGISNGANRLQLEATANGSTQVQIFGSQSFLADKWYHIVGQWDGSYLRLYQDGVAVGTPTAFTGPIFSNTGSNLIIGKSFRFGNQFPGIIDDVRIYNRALSATEISNLYKQGAVALNVSPTARLADGLVGYWTFDGKDTTASTATDRSGNGNIGTITGATPTIGKIGQALRFKSNEHISISPALNSTNIYTTSAWVRINGTTPDGYQCILSQDYNNNILCYGDSEKKFLAYANYSAFYTDTTYPIGKWYHVSVVHNPTTQYIYVDGVLAGTSSNTNASSLQYIGSAENTVETLNGDLDEVRIYNRALSAAEVKQLYLMGK